MFSVKDVVETCKWLKVLFEFEYMYHSIKIFLRSMYKIFTPKAFYSNISGSTNFREDVVLGALSSLATAFSTGLWFTFTAELFGLGSAGGFNDLLLFTLLAMPSILLLISVSGYLTKLFLYLMGKKTSWREHFKAYALSLPSFFVPIQIPVVNISAPFYIIYVQIRGVSELTDTEMSKAAIGWMAQAILLSLIAIIPLVYYSISMNL